jgi:predicted nucleic acid-binding Zn ribbon protein
MMSPSVENEKAAAYTTTVSSSRDDTMKTSKEDSMPGAVAVAADCSNVPPDKNFCSNKDDDDIEAKIVRKMMKEDDINNKYHQSVMKKDEKKKRDWFFLWMGLLTLIFLGLMIYAFVSGIFLPGDDTLEPLPSVTTAERQEYYDNLLVFFNSTRLEPSSPQEQAMKWMGFQDEPLPIPEETSEDSHYQRVRLEQRYALATWYFAQGGPNLWSTINRDTGAGWIEFGTGVHECKWRGIDCSAMQDDEANGDDDDGLRKEQYKVVVGVRLSSSQGVVLTGTSLSKELGLLTHIRRLDFSSQRLQGTIPEEWKHMTNLGKFDVDVDGMLILAYLSQSSY